MTRVMLSALFTILCFTGLIHEYMSISVWQTPENITWSGTDENITCHIKVDSDVKRFVVKWMQENATLGKSEVFNISRSNASGSVFINATLNLLSVRKYVNSGMYYCTAREDLPLLGPTENGNGTYVYVVNTTTTPSTLFTVTGPPNHDNKHIVKWSLLSGLGFALLIVSIACVSHIFYKGCHRIERRANEPVLVDASDRSPSPETLEAVVYSAIKIPRDSMKSKKETSAPLALTSETCTQDSVTYAEVHIKKRPKDEG